MVSNSLPNVSNITGPGSVGVHLYQTNRALAGDVALWIGSLVSREARMLSLVMLPCWTGRSTMALVKKSLAGCAMAVGDSAAPAAANKITATPRRRAPIQRPAFSRHDSAILLIISVSKCGVSSPVIWVHRCSNSGTQMGTDHRITLA